MKSIVNTEYMGIVLSDKDPKNMWRIKVHIPDLMYNIGQNEGIWVKNEISGSSHIDSERGTYGSYHPLQSGTRVAVVFKNNDFNSGSVVRTVASDVPNTLPDQISDRDDYTQLVKTISDTRIAICDNTVDQPQSSFHEYFKTNRTTRIIDEQGIHIHTDDNIDTNIMKEEQKKVLGKSVEEYRNDVDRSYFNNTRIGCGGNYNFHVFGNKLVKIDGKSNTIINGDDINRILGCFQINSSGHILLKASQIFLEAGIINFVGHVRSSKISPGPSSTGFLGVENAEDANLTNIPSRVQSSSSSTSEQTSMLNVSPSDINTMTFNALKNINESISNSKSEIEDTISVIGTSSDISNILTDSASIMTLFSETEILFPHQENVIIKSEPIFLHINSPKINIPENINTYALRYYLYDKFDEYVKNLQLFTESTHILTPEINITKAVFKKTNNNVQSKINIEIVFNKYKVYTYIDETYIIENEIDILSSDTEYEEYTAYKLLTEKYFLNLLDKIIPSYINDELYYSDNEFDDQINLSLLPNISVPNIVFSDFTIEDFRKNIFENNFDSIFSGYNNILFDIFDYYNYENNHTLIYTEKKINIGYIDIVNFSYYIEDNNLKIKWDIIFNCNLTGDSLVYYEMDESGDIEQKSFEDILLTNISSINDIPKSICRFNFKLLLQQHIREILECNDDKLENMYVVEKYFVPIEYNVKEEERRIVVNNTTRNRTFTTSSLSNINSRVSANISDEFKSEDVKKSTTLLGGLASTIKSVSSIIKSVGEITTSVSNISTTGFNTYQIQLNNISFLSNRVENLQNINILSDISSRTISRLNTISSDINSLKTKIKFDNLSSDLKSFSDNPINAMSAYLNNASNIINLSSRIGNYIVELPALISKFSTDSIMSAKNQVLGVINSTTGMISSTASGISSTISKTATLASGVLSKAETTTSTLNKTSSSIEQNSKKVENGSFKLGFSDILTISKNTSTEVNSSCVQVGGTPSQPTSSELVEINKALNSNSSSDSTLKNASSYLSSTGQKLTAGIINTSKSITSYIESTIKSMMPDWLKNGENPLKTLANKVSGLAGVLGITDGIDTSMSFVNQVKSFAKNIGLTELLDSTKELSSATELIYSGLGKIKSTVSDDYSYTNISNQLSNLSSSINRTSSALKNFDTLDKLEMYLNYAKENLTPDATDEDKKKINTSLDTVKSIREDINNTPTDLTSNISSLVTEINKLSTDTTISGSLDSLKTTVSKTTDSINKINTCADTITTKSQSIMNSLDMSLGRSQTSISAASEKSKTLFVSLCGYENKYKQQTENPNSNRSLPERIVVSNVKEYLDKEAGTPVLKYPQK